MHCVQEIVSNRMIYIYINTRCVKYDTRYSVIYLNRCVASKKREHVSHSYSFYNLIMSYIYKRYFNCNFICLVPLTFI